VANNKEDPVRIGSCGKPYREVELKILDEDDEELPPNSVGEIVVRPSKPFLFLLFRGIRRCGGSILGHLLMQADYSELPRLFKISQVSARRKIENLLDLFEQEVNSLYPELNNISPWKIRHVAAYSTAQGPRKVGSYSPPMELPGIKNLYQYREYYKRGERHERAGRKP
jgi:hypothetical protein